MTNDGTYEYIYDCENRLIEAKENGQTVATYAYDYLGRRVHRFTYHDSQTTKYCYDGDQVIAEYDLGGNLLRRYFYGPGIDEPICMIDVATGDKYYYHFDGVGSVVAISDTNANIVERYSYDVFGEPNTTSTIGNPYLFTARRYDSETGLYYYRARHYDYYVGRFLQNDPANYYHSMNLYTYCLNNPVNYTDPMGMYERKTAFSIAKIKYITNDGRTHKVNIASKATLKHILMEQKFSGRKIAFFEYAGHGFEEGEGLYIGHEGIWADDITGDFKSLIASVFDPQATIELEACQSARGRESIAHRFKEVLPHARVYGYTGNALKIYFVDETIRNIKPWGKHGKWIEVKARACKK